jgi:hypothetical protein
MLTDRFADSVIPYVIHPKRGSLRDLSAFNRSTQVPDDLFSTYSLYEQESALLEISHSMAALKPLSKHAWGNLMWKL